MTQVSIPWAGTTIGDAGPYTAVQWWDIWQVFMRSHGALLGAGNIGVFYQIGNRLSASVPGANQVDVSDGSAILDGLYYHSDAAESITVPSAAAGNLRADRIVLRKTFGALTQTARLVRLAGAEIAAPGPAVPPAITQDTARLTFWDIPLWIANVTDAGAVTLTDERDYVGQFTKQIHIPALPFHELYGTDFNNIYGGAVGLLDAADHGAGMNWQVPEDIIDGLVIDILGGNAGCAAGNFWYLSQTYQWGADGASSTSNQVVVAARQVSTATPSGATIGVIPDCRMTLAGAAASDWVWASLVRNGNHASDTCGLTLRIHGFQASYRAIVMPK